jgi:hypothetical protein
MKTTTTIDLSGPFFTNDPRKTFRQNVRVLMAAVAAEGESDVKAQLRAGESGRYPISHKVQPSHVSGHVVGRVRSLTGKPWAVTAVVSVNNSGFTKAQGIALMASAAWVESQVHAFRKTTGRIRRARALNTVELLKGIQ